MAPSLHSAWHPLARHHLTGSLPAPDGGGMNCGRRRWRAKMIGFRREKRAGGVTDEACRGFQLPSSVISLAA